jgi:polysaccharide export outer membrane protein
MQPVDVAGGELYTLSYALVLAGGLTPNADLRNIVIRREAPASQPGTSDSGKTEIRVNLWQILRSGNLSSDLRLQDGDEIVVPTASLNTADQQQLLSSSLAPTTISVQVAGEVNSPGQITIAPNADVNMAVAAAGGPARGAARNRIRLLRMAPNGQLEQQNFRFGEESVTLREGDVIVIERRGSQRFLDVVGQVLNPLNFLNFLF